jgi:hypothetical protein
MIAFHCLPDRERRICRGRRTIELPGILTCEQQEFSHARRRKKTIARGLTSQRLFAYSVPYPELDLPIEVEHLLAFVFEPSLIQD